MWLMTLTLKDPKVYQYFKNHQGGTALLASLLISSFLYLVYPCSVSSASPHPVHSMSLLLGVGGDLLFSGLFFQFAGTVCFLGNH